MVLVGARTTFPARTNFFFYFKNKIKNKISKVKFQKKIKKLNYFFQNKKYLIILRILWECL